MLKNMILSKQKSIMWLGAFIDSLFATLPFLSVVNFLSIQAVLYAYVMEYILPWAPWLTFVRFIVLMVLATLGAMVLIYKFVIPSLWVWRGQQLYGHQSIMMDEVKALRKENKKLKRRIAEEVKGLRLEIHELRKDLAKPATA